MESQKYACTEAAGRQNVALDMLRFVALILVITTHVSSVLQDVHPVGTLNRSFSQIINAVSHCSVPLYLMISGGLFLAPEKQVKISVLYKKYIYHLVCALLFWSLTYAAANSFLAFIKGAEITLSNFWSLFCEGNYHLWYLFMLIGLYIFMPCLKKIAEDRNVLCYFVTLNFIFSIVFSNLENLFGIHLSYITGKLIVWFLAGYTGYYAMGALLFHVKLDKKQLYVAILIGVASIGLTCGLSLTMPAMQPLFTDYMAPLIFIYSSMVFIVILTLCNVHQFSERTAKALCVLRKYGFGIYLVHDLFVILFRELFHFAQRNLPSIFSIIVATIFIFVASFIVVHLLKKIPVLNKYII